MASGSRASRCCASRSLAGVLTPAQLRALAIIADKYSTSRGHLTTRENVQFHFVKLENVGAAMRFARRCGPHHARGLR